MQRGVGMGRGGFVGAWHAVPGAAPEALSQKHGVTCGVLAWNGTTPPSTLPGTACHAPTKKRRRQTASLKYYGTVIQVVQTLFLDCLPSGPCAVTEMRCLPDSKSSFGLVPVIPGTAPTGFAGSGIGNRNEACFAPAEISYADKLLDAILGNFLGAGGSHPEIVVECNRDGVLAVRSRCGRLGYVQYRRWR